MKTILANIATALLIALVLSLPLQTEDQEKRAADYAEECKHESCSAAELKALYDSYNDECVAEKCSKEEVIEIAGNPSLVNALLNDFKAHGWKVNPADFPNCKPINEEAICWGVVMLCRTSYSCPDGNFQGAQHVCGPCLGAGKSGETKKE